MSDEEDDLPHDFDELQKRFKAGEMKFELAAQDEVDIRDADIRALLRYTMDAEDSDIADSALITDESMLYDFHWGKEEYKEAVAKINAILGKDVGIEDRDYLWQVVDKIKAQFPNWPNITLVK